MDSSFQLFPDSASTFSDEVDHLLLFLLGVSGFFVLVILAFIVYFAVRYRRRSDADRPEATRTNLKLELLWTIIPLIIALTIFVWGARVYARLLTPPENALEIYVIGKQWMWKVQHPEGRREINALHIPVNRPIKLIMSSKDVIHSFFVPDFRTKHDVVPGRYTTLWFEATRTGEYRFSCAEYCGTDHAEMTGRIVVMEPDAYQRWLAGGEAEETAAEAGRRLFQQLGCTGCHGQSAPTMAGLYGSEVQLRDGRTVIADNNYIRQSILDSTAKVTAGYDPVMPSYQGQVSEEQLVQLLAYIKSLKNPKKASPPKP